MFQNDLGANGMANSVTFRSSLVWVCTFCSELPFPIHIGVPVAQWVKCWPTDLVVPGFEFHSRQNLLNPKLGSIAHRLPQSSAHPPDMTEILLKGCKITSHPAIPIHVIFRYTPNQSRFLQLNAIV